MTVRLFIAMNKVFWLRFVALNGVLSVVLGAFAAHGLEDQLSDRHMATFRTAVLYHFYTPWHYWR